MKAWGFTEEQVAEWDKVRVWRANRVSVAVFRDMTTQWRFSPGGPSGLDYAALPPVMEFHGVPTDARRRVFADIGAMEDAALAVFQEQRERARETQKQ